MHWFKQPAQHVPTKHSSWWRRLEDVFRLRLHNPSSRRLDQDEYIRLSHTSSEDVLVKTNIFVLAIRLQDVFKTSSRRLAKMSSRRLAKTSSRRLQDVFKTSSRHLQDVFKTSCKNVFKTSSRRLQDVLQKYLQDVFKTYHQVKLFLLTSLQDVFNMFLRRTTKRTICRRICLGHTSEKVMVSVQIWKSHKNVSSFSFSLDYTFWWLLTEAYLEPGRTSTMEFFLQKYLIALSC